LFEREEEEVGATASLELKLMQSIKRLEQMTNLLDILAFLGTGNRQALGLQAAATARAGPDHGAFSALVPLPSAAGRPRHCPGRSGPGPGAAKQPVTFGSGLQLGSAHEGGPLAQRR